METASHSQPRDRHVESRRRLPFALRRRLVRGSLVIVGWLLLGGCGSEPDRHGVIEVDLLARLTQSTRRSGYVDPGNPQHQLQVGEGWHAPERNRKGKTYAWTSTETATLWVPYVESKRAVLFMRGYGADDGGDARSLTLWINGRSLGSRSVPSMPSTLEFDVPEQVLRIGDNEVTIEVDRCVEIGSRRLGFLVDYVLIRSHESGERAPVKDPIETAKRPLLDTRHSVDFRSSDLPLGTLELNWTGTGNVDGDRLVVEVFDETQTQELVSATFEAEATTATLELPPAMPYRSVLRMRLQSSDGDLPRGALELKRASLVMPAPAHDVILIVVDTLRPDYLSCYGGAEHTADTPAIDGLATDGILFENAFSQIPITGPSHASMLTSLHPSEVGVLNNNRGNVPRELPFWPDLFRRRGYDTSGVVSIGPIQGYLGFSRGWRAYDDRMGLSWIVPGEVILERGLEALNDVRRPLFFWTHFSDPHEPYDAHGLVRHEAEVFVAGERVATVETTRYRTIPIDLELPDEEVEVVIGSDHPFHVRRLSFGKQDPQTPSIEPPKPPARDFEEYRARIGAEGRRQVQLVVAVSDKADGVDEIQRRYGCEVAFTDEQVGGLLQRLRATNRYEESWIVFTSDHGEGLGCHDHLGHVQNLYDCLTHVPLIIKPPRSLGLPAGTRRPDLAALTDLLPTMLARTGLAPLPSAVGRDLLADDSGHFDGAVFMETHAPEAKKTKYGLRSRARKIVWTPDGDAWELYDLLEDPEESKNLIDEQPQEAARWRERLETFIAALYSPTHAGEQGVPLDPKTEEMLRSLGYVQ